MPAAARCSRRSCAPPEVFVAPPVGEQGACGLAGVLGAAGYPYRSGVPEALGERDGTLGGVCQPVADVQAYVLTGSGHWSGWWARRSPGRGRRGSSRRILGRSMYMIMGVSGLVGSGCGEWGAVADGEDQAAGRFLALQELHGLLPYGPGPDGPYRADRPAGRAVAELDGIGSQRGFSWRLLGHGWGGPAEGGPDGRQTAGHAAVRAFRGSVTTQSWPHGDRRTPSPRRLCSWPQLGHLTMAWALPLVARSAARTIGTGLLAEV